MFRWVKLTFFLLLPDAGSIEIFIFYHINRASVMSGCHAGVHVFLRKFMPKGIYIHCSAHRLNLVINDTCKVVCYMSDYFSIVANIYSFFTASGVTNQYFKQAQQQLGLGTYSANILLQNTPLLFWYDV